MNLFLHILILKVGFIYTSKCHKPVPCSSNSILEEEGICTSTMLAVKKCDQNVLTILGDIEVKVCSMLNLLYSTTLVV